MIMKWGTWSGVKPPFRKASTRVACEQFGMQRCHYADSVASTRYAGYKAAYSYAIETYHDKEFWDLQAVSLRSAVNLGMEY